MEKISERIKELRQRKGYSQDRLAEAAGLNLRTIQRIENGETIPRGDSLQRLAQAFEVSPDDLIDWTVKEDKSMLAILNMSQLSFLAFPILGILVPLIIWLNQKDKVSHVKKLGESILNFQITWSILAFMVPIGFIFIPILLELDMSLATVFTVSIAMYAYNIGVILLNTILVANDRRAFYAPAFRFLG